MKNAAQTPIMPSDKKKISLALQGGGAHGAFTWGVLDYILEDGRIEVEAISAASAGAMNAVALIDGWMEGGTEGARKQLESFWRAISYDSKWSSPQRTAIGALMDPFGVTKSFSGFWSDWLQQTASPYDFNPLDINPLEMVLNSQIDFKRIQGCDDFRLSISATNVETGKIRIFERREITARHIMASACLPTLFQAVVIDNTPYWDGGYMGNPALYPLFYGPNTDDVLLVQVNPICRPGIPKAPQAIQQRLNEITFNATLLREFRAVEFVGRLVDQGVLPTDKYKSIKMHRIEPGMTFTSIANDTKQDSGWDALQRWRDAGRKSAKTWLIKNYDEIGVKSTFDLKDEL